MTDWNFDVPSGSGSPVSTYWTPLFTRDGLPTLSPGNVWANATTANTFMWYSIVSAQTNDKVNWNMWMDASSYTVDIYGFLAPNFGIGAIQLDGTDIFTFDQFRSVDPGTGVYQPNMGSFVIGSPGIHTISARVTGTKNGGSSAFNIGLSGVFLRGGNTHHSQFPYGRFAYQVTGNAGAFHSPYKSWTLYSPEFLVGLTGQQPQGSIGDVIYTPYDLLPGVSGNAIAQSIWIDAGTYNFDMQVVIGTTHGVGKLTVDGVAVGTPNAPGTPRIIPGGGVSGGNGNNGGSALVTGEVDFYDTVSATPTDAVITNALTGIVIPTSGYHNVKMTCSGHNSAATDFSMAVAGWFRKVG